MGEWGVWLRLSLLLLVLEGGEKGRERCEDKIGSELDD